MTWQRWSVIPIWVLAILGAAAVAVVAGPAFLTWIAVLLGALVLVTAAIQLSIRRKEGFVGRLVASLGGALVVLVLTTAVLVAVHPGAVALYVGRVG